MFQIETTGSNFVLLRPLTADVKSWLDEHTDESAQWFGNALCVEHRYVEDIVHGLIEEGFVGQ